MHLFVASMEDPASISMGNAIIRDGRFQPEADGLYRYKECMLALINQRHLYWNGVEDIEQGSGNKIQDVVFLSRHSSAAGIRSITVHPTGNYGSAELGGEPQTLTQSNPSMMTSYLRYVKEAFKNPSVEVTFEATHHGPLIYKPNFYFEIGTTEREWNDSEILEVCMDTIFCSTARNERNFVGVGGGHYMTKVTQYVLENSVNVGHMISKHSLAEITESMIMQAVEKTPQCSGFLIDRKGVKSRQKEIINHICDERSLEKIVI